MLTHRPRPTEAEFWAAGAKLKQSSVLQRPFLDQLVGDERSVPALGDQFPSALAEMQFHMMAGDLWVAERHVVVIGAADAYERLFAESPGLDPMPPHGIE